MPAPPRTVRLTTAQAIVRYLANQLIDIDGVKQPLCGGGFAVINKLQNNTGNVSFNNLIADCNIEGEPFAVDFATHARTMGAATEAVHSIAELKQAFGRAKQSKKTYVISIKVNACEGRTKEGRAWWEIGTPSVSNRAEVLQAHDDVERGRSRQRVGV
jgi:3D-(3,5/4)-trihydroxycyclohexane-1,2-dione acylhydrolase (decyclizing)